MALTWQQRQECLGPALEMTTAVGKLGMRAVVDAIDDWVDANASSYNLAIPQPARSILTAGQKAQLLFLVARKRFGG